MFKIIKYRNDSGKILMTIETDDQMAADFCRFFGTINKFVDLFNYRVRSAKSFDLYKKTAPHKLALMKKEFAEQLERFRSMPGTRIERMRILKEIRVSNGDPVTLDRIDAEIRRAIQYEKEGIQILCFHCPDSHPLAPHLTYTIAPHIIPRMRTTGEYTLPDTRSEKMNEIHG